MKVLCVVDQALFLYTGTHSGEFVTVMVDTRVKLKGVNEKALFWGGMARKNGEERKRIHCSISKTGS